MTTSASDFFERQEAARRATRRLVLWFSLGVAGTALAIYFVLCLLLGEAGGGNLTEAWFPGTRLGGHPFLDPALFAVVAAGTLLVVGGASLFKSLELSGSTGADIAEQLGGREVSPSAARPDERRLLNVVQEMSLASGVPVPRIFILENEQSINAFAAGTRTDRAAVAVSRGALDKLSRDELQAVIGHEFSHILNGDMRLNIRLIGWIFGLVVISVLGQILFRSAAYQPRSRSRDGKNAAGVLLAFGLALIVIGFISRLFAQIIQAAISRHRERLADASATQFTRNPKALANALSRIGGDALGSRISAPRAQEFAHLFFADGVNALFSTHPPLEERIRALDPAWNGKFLPPLNAEERARQEEGETRARRQNPDAAPKNSSRPSSAAAAVPALLFLSEMSRTADDAKTLIYLLMMTDSPAHNVDQAKILLARERRDVFKKMENLWARTKDFPREKRIDGVLVAAPALRELSARERSEFCETLDLLAQADGNVSFYEFCVSAALRGMLVSDGREKCAAAEAAPEAELALNLFLRASGCAPQERERVLAKAIAEQNAFPPAALRVRDDDAPSVPALEAAFAKLRATPESAREQLLAAAAAIVEADGKISAVESDLLKSFAVALNCPPPRI